MRAFVRVSPTKPVSNETTTLKVRHLPETKELAPVTLGRANAYVAGQKQMLKRGSFLEATIIAAFSSKKNTIDQRDPEMLQRKKETSDASR